MLSDYSKQLRWSYISSIVTATVQVISTSAMARLLHPADFGVMAVLSMLYSAMNYFAQFGVGRAIIQKAEIRRDEMQFAFTTAMVLGGVSALVMCIGAPGFARFFRQPHSVGAIRLYSLNFILQGFALTSIAVLRRQLRIRRLAVIETSSFTIGQLVLGVPAALLGAGYWALIASTLGQSLILAAGAYISVRHPLRPRLSIAKYGGLLAFGGKASCLSVIEYLNGSTDMFILARMVSAPLLGIYNRSFVLINLPLSYLSNGLQKVLLPAMAREQNDLERLRKVVSDATRSFAAIAIPLGVGAALCAHSIVLTILGPQWVDAVVPFRWLCVAAVFNSLSHVFGLQTEAMGRFRGKTCAQLTVLVAMFVGVYSGARNGIAHAAFAVAAVEALRCFLLVSVASRLVKSSPFDVFRSWMPAVGASIAVGAVAAALDNLAFSISPLALLGLTIVSCSFVLLAFYRLLWAESVLVPLSTLFGPRIEGYIRKSVSARAIAVA